RRHDISAAAAFVAGARAGGAMTSDTVLLSRLQFAWTIGYHILWPAYTIGIVTGVVLSYEIGTNWSGFANDTANVIGPYFTYEVMTAFFLEAGFIGVMLFGMNRVGQGFHFVACCMVALGAMFSAFWILAANSWMQTPAGFTIGADGKFQ